MNPYIEAYIWGKYSKMCIRRITLVLTVRVCMAQERLDTNELLVNHYLFLNNGESAVCGFTNYISDSSKGGLMLICCIFFSKYILKNESLTSPSS